MPAWRQRRHGRADVRGRWSGSAIGCSPDSVTPVIIAWLPTSAEKAAALTQGNPNRLGWRKHNANQTRERVEEMRRSLPSLRVVPAMDGHNHTAMIEYLLQQRIPFRDLSKGWKKWGTLACALAHYRALQYQVEERLPWMLRLEDDVRIASVPAYSRMLDEACTVQAKKNVTLLQLSHFLEASLTSLAGATRLTALIRNAGIRKAIDQQLMKPEVMGGRHTVKRWTEHWKWTPPPLAMWRPANSPTGEIFHSNEFTWTELQLLRLATDPAASALPMFGNPPIQVGSKEYVRTIVE